MKKLYKNIEAKIEIMKLYEEKLSQLGIVYEEIDVPTSYGTTRVITTGNNHAKPIVVFHGINAGAPLTLEAIKDLAKDYKIYAIDTIGQATKSAENRINIYDHSYGKWANEVLLKLKLNRSNFIGISYGAYILQKLIALEPAKVEKAIFVVPSGLVNGSFWMSIKKLSIPLTRYLITKKEHHLKLFLNAFVSDDDEFMFRLQKALLTGLNMDFRRPSLLKAEEVVRFENPVYIMVAEEDVFFPGKEAINRVKKLFKNVKGIHTVKGKHMPSSSTFNEINSTIKSWLES